MGNMNCAGQKANSKDFNDNYDRIFKKQFFDVIDELDDILEETNQKEEMQYCRWCGVKCGEIPNVIWKETWKQRCDECDERLKNGEYINPNGN